MDWTQWRSQPKNWGGKMFDFRRITLLCLDKRLSKHKMTIFLNILWEAWPLWPTPGYAYDWTLDVLDPKAYCLQKDQE